MCFCRCNNVSTVVFSELNRSFISFQTRGSFVMMVALVQALIFMLMDECDPAGVEEVKAKFKHLIVVADQILRYTGLPPSMKSLSIVWIALQHALHFYTINFWPEVACELSFASEKDLVLSETWYGLDRLVLHEDRFEIAAALPRCMQDCQDVRHSLKRQSDMPESCQAVFRDFEIILGTVDTILNRRSCASNLRNGMVCPEPVSHRNRSRSRSRGSYSWEGFHTFRVECY